MENRMSKTTKLFYGRPITLDEDKYYYEELSSSNSELLIRDKKNNNIIAKFLCPGFILQIGENEFITTDLIDEKTFKFQHLHYSNKTGRIKTIFQKI